MNFRPTSRAELGATLLALSTLNPESPKMARTLALKCAVLARRIAEDPALAGPVPEIVWHFLSDVDIRFKDIDYARQQSARLVESLRSWN